MNPSPFKPITTAATDRMREHVKALASATSTYEQIASLFLLHCEMKDVELGLPEIGTEPVPVPAEDAAAVAAVAQGEEV